MSASHDVRAPELPFFTLRWEGGLDGCVRLLDQTLLPGEEAYIQVRTLEGMWEAIRMLRVRGAPAIGVAAAMGLVLGVRGSMAHTVAAFREDTRRAAARLAEARPTAVNLFWALRRMERVIETHPASDVPALKRRLLDEALAIYEEDRATCRAIGRHGAPLLPDPATVLTHCNAGALATAGQGTALSVLYEAHAQGKRLRVFADETRPLLQGARLTAWELHRAGIAVTVICDGAAAHTLRTQRVDAVIVGADRIAANGDVANKIGTCGLAIAARAHKVPFYVAAPLSTFDRDLPDGAGIPIEQRPAEEVLALGGRRTAPDGVAAFNPAFDVTPNEYIAAIITEHGVIERPDRARIAAHLHAARTGSASPVGAAENVGRDASGAARSERKQ